jgi:hypothetical protein
MIFNRMEYGRKLEKNLRRRAMKRKTVWFGAAVFFMLSLLSVGNALPLGFRNCP